MFSGTTSGKLQNNWQMEMLEQRIVSQDVIPYGCNV